MTRQNGCPGRLSRAAVRRLARSDDSGATLVIALIFITVVSIVIAAILSFVDTSMRTTIAVRGEAATAAAADGAAQIAINTLRENRYAVGGSGPCLAGMPPSLDDFYHQGGTSYSAVVRCDLDSDDSVAGVLPITDGNRPGQAILTLGAGADGGLEVFPWGSDVLKVHGDIFSNSYITAQQNLTGSAGIRAVGHCVANAGGVMQSATGTLTTNPTGPKCDLGAPGAWADPDYAAPIDDLDARDAPRCTGPRGARVLTFTPGIYTNLVALNDLTSSSHSNRCRASILWFQPGTYYFDLSGTWSIQSGYVVGGTPTSTLNAASPPQTAGSCVTPIAPDGAPPGSWTPPGPDAGVAFVLGGTSRISLGNAFMELCGTYSTDRPPIALYGLKADDGPVPAAPDKLCADETSGLPPGNNGSTCATLYSDTSPNSHLYIQGTTYMPNAWVDVNINNSSGQVFRFGIITRKLTLFSTASADLSGPVIEVPDRVLPGPGRTVLYLRVFVCPGTTPCPTGGGAQPQLTVKVGIGDPSGTAVPGKRQVTVYNWSVQRS